ncbi:MAG: alpha/beta hydrolase, partial [Anaerolineae bacterium]|nr:alpha/beta hydrolase [Anaerolineae bacterium]
MMHWYDQVLAELPCNSLYVDTRYGETHLLTAGSPDAPPLVLVHGINVSALNWQAQIRRLAADYYVIAPDVIGFAGRSAPVRLPYAGDGY